MDLETILISLFVLGIIVVLFLFSEEMVRLTTFDALDENLKKKKDRLYLFLENNHHIFYSPRSWVIIQKIKDEDGYEAKILELVRPEMKKNAGLIKRLKAVTRATVMLSNAAAKKPFIVFLKSIHKYNYEWALKKSTITINLVKGLGLKQMASDLELHVVA